MVRAVQAALFIAGFASAHGCHDVTANDTDNASKTCLRNLMWAKTDGVINQPDLYKNYTGLTKDSDLATFQCVLWRKSQNGVDANGAEGHGCVEPCTATVGWNCPGGTEQQAATKDAGTDVVASPKDTNSGGMPWYGWLLIVLGVCCLLPCLIVGCMALMCYEAVSFLLDPIMGKKGPQKKKRAVKKPVAAPTAAPAAAATAPVTTSFTRVAAPVATTAVPMPVYTTYAAPQAAPTVTTVMAPSVMYAAPAASVSYAAPAVPSAVPAASVSYAAPAVPSTLYAAEPTALAQ